MAVQNMTMKDIITLAIRQYDEQADGNGRYDQDNPQYFLLLAWANDIYKDMCRSLRTSRNTCSITTIINQRDYTLPDDFASLRRIYLQFGAHQYKLVRQNEADNTDDLGSPMKYYQDLNIIGFDPIPDDAYTIQILYYNMPTIDLVLTDSVTMIRYDFQHVIADGLTMRMFETDKGQTNPATVQWMQRYQKGCQDIINYYKEGLNDDMYVPV